MVKNKTSSTSPIRAVIFDFGGVLVRTEDDRPRKELAARLGLSESELYEIVFENESARLATIGEVTTQRHWEAVRAELGVSQEMFGEVPLSFWGGDKLDVELVDAIRSLRSRYKTALLSNAWDNLRQVLEEHWQIVDVFDELIISAEVGVAKPDPRIYQITLERLEVAPEEAVFIDDFPRNVDAARQAGLNAIRFRNTRQVLNEIYTLLDHR